MLIRVDGGKSGIVDYLINGKKAGRNYHRDELDERVFLSGNLDVADFLINNMEGQGERYKHITLAFKEDDLSIETLQAINDEVKAYICAAYKDDEICYYAEAHLPKIKSLIDEKTGKPYPRMPHIHIVIPTENLFDNQVANPFGYYPHSQKFAKALQEHINAKFNLADPADNRRTDFSSKADIISRINSDEFSGAGKELKTEIRAAMIEQDITSYESFKNLLQRYGTVKEVQGKYGEHLNLVPHGQSKGINFNRKNGEHVFSRAFIELPTLEKIQQLTKVAKFTAEERSKLMQEWVNVRSKEIKYLNSGDKKYKLYQKMSEADKLKELKRQETEFYKEQGVEHEPTNERTDRRAAAFERIGDNLRSSSADLAAARGAAGNLDRAAGNIADRAAIRAVAAALDGRTGNQRQSRPPAERDTQRTASVVGRYRRELDERGAVAKASKGGEFGEIKQNLEAGRLLAHLSKTHGVLADKYVVTRGRDGSERIKCGNQNLNVSDFLTKHMNLPWKDAAPILREVYAAQRGNVHHQAKPAPSRELWDKYQSWKQHEAPKERSQAAAAITRTHADAIDQATKDFNAAKSRIQGDRSITRAEAKRLIDIAKATREHAKKEARDSRNAARAAERAKWSAKGDNLLKRFLAEAAQTNESHAEAALAELRKRAPDIAEKEDAANYIKAADQQAKEQGAPIKRDLRYTVDLKGHITYRIDGQEALKDEGKRVNILRASDGDVIEEGLYLAKSKFGKTLTLHGSDQFKAEAVRIAVEKNIPVDFSDPHLQRMKHQLEQQKIDRQRLREQGRKAIEVERARKEKEKADAALQAREKAKPKAKDAEAKKPAAVVKEQAAAPAPEPVLAVPGAQAPHKQHGTYKGEILAVDNTYVYQQTEKAVIHHLRTQFNELPKPGDEVAIRYSAGQVTHVKDLDRGHGHGR
ncbi:hypothetical protein ABIB38_004660 [Massilia sp. UYP11]|uniref:LPD7 domain-containing protein n=1 Tax=Massilia sp. UYP11 TaxID=1756385 RepID=UPI003D212878